MLNLIKGTGINGISGIPDKRDKIIRPFLGITKEEVLKYLNYYGIKFRIDPTNESIDYERNYLRNEVIPSIEKKLNPKFNQAIFKASENYKKIRMHLEKVFTVYYDSICKFVDGNFEINLNELKLIDEDLHDEFLRFALKKKFPFEFNYAGIEALSKLIEGQTGKMVKIGGGLSAVKERNSIVISPAKKIMSREPLKLKIGESAVFNNETLSIRKSKKENFVISGNPKKEYISADLLADEFIIRQWKSGDRFFPLGLNGSKKISDFLNEIKIPSSKKKNQLLLTNKGNVVWVIGHRIDDRVKIKNNTNKVIELWIR